MILLEDLHLPYVNYIESEIPNLNFDNLILIYIMLDMESSRVCLELSEMVLHVHICQNLRVLWFIEVRIELRILKIISVLKIYKIPGNQLWRALKWKRFDIFA